ncbi:MAG: hypothetical protein Kow0037_15760 [Calditrichia bacterium]
MRIAVPTLLVILIFSWGVLQAEDTGTKMIPHERLLSPEEIGAYVRPGIAELSPFYTYWNTGAKEQALKWLVNYLNDRMAERYYFSWKSFEKMFEHYRAAFPDKQELHFRESEYQLNTYPAEAKWKLPQQNLKGEEVTAYQLRHLARQHRARDMALVHFYSGKKTDHPEYFYRQVMSLNDAFEKNQYDDGGNGIYEVFRAGKRVQAWLFCYNLYLAAGSFDYKQQLDLILTFLHHGAQLYHRSQKMRHGNHHTKGVTALFELAALFPEFVGADKWQSHATNGILWHLRNEVNPDGFQFERSVHYHIGDIENYFRVFQLSQRGSLKLSGDFQPKLKSMFEALVKIAQPDRKVPVLQDDTDDKYAETNDIKGIMAVGAITFKNSQYRYFTDGSPNHLYFWLLNEPELLLAEKLPEEPPRYGSLALESTGYYVFRGGWAQENLFLIISAGLSKRKPDHQHGDMLGISGYALGHQVLPNYQVKYNDSTYIHWKNSWVKNVAVVDSVLQGRRWRANRGKSGFGKWIILPEPKVLAWETMPNFDYFVGTHNGYDSLGVSYFRTVYHLANGGWIVRDEFISDQPHSYQQIWQGNFEVVNPREIERKFPDGVLFKIRQLNPFEGKILTGSLAKKHWSVFQVKGKKEYEFLTLLKPEKSQGKVKMETGTVFKLLNGWRVNTQDSDSWLEAEAKYVFLKGEEGALVLGAGLLKIGNFTLKLNQPSDFWITRTETEVLVKKVDRGAVEVTIQAETAALLNQSEKTQLSTGEVIKLERN